MNGLLIFALVLDEFEKPIYKLAVNQSLFSDYIQCTEQNIYLYNILETNVEVTQYLSGYMDCFSKHNNNIYREGYQWDWIAYYVDNIGTPIIILK
jgi:hypothetical protein